MKRHALSAAEVLIQNPEGDIRSARKHRIRIAKHLTVSILDPKGTPTVLFKPMLQPHMRQIPFRDRSVFSAAFFFQHFFRESPGVKRWKDTVRHRVADSLRANGPGTLKSVDRRPGLKPEEFRREYLSRGLPVLIPGGAKSWPCMRWSFDSLKERFGQETIKLVHEKGVSDEEFIDFDRFHEEVNFGQFLDQVVDGGMKYMRFSPLLERFPELRGEIDRRFFREMMGRPMGICYQAFVGGKGTFTPLHNNAQPFFFVNVTGIKRWALIPNHYMPVLDPHPSGFGYNHSDATVEKPDPEKFPGIDAIDRLEALMEPGDVLHVPSWMWHSVRNEAPTIGVRCGFLCPRTMMGESPGLFITRLLAARNPSIWKAFYLSYVKRNCPERDDGLMTPTFFSTEQ